MEASEDGTTSLSKTSVENVVVAALRDGLLVSPGPVGSRFDIDVCNLETLLPFYFNSVLYSQSRSQRI